MPKDPADRIRAHLASSRGGPCVVSVRGSGASKICQSVMESVDGVLSAVPHGAIADRVERVVWFHGADALSTADVVICSALLWGMPWKVLLSGPCSEAGPPGAQRERGEGYEAGTGWTVVTGGPTASSAEDAEQQLAAAERRGDATTAISLLSLLQQRSRPAAERWEWLWAERLVRLGRQSQVASKLSRSRTLGPELLTLLAELAMARRDWGRATGLLEAAAGHEEPLPGTAEDVAHLLAVAGTRLEVPRHEVPTPGRPWRVARAQFEAACEVGGGDETWEGFEFHGDEPTMGSYTGVEGASELSGALASALSSRPVDRLQAQATVLRLGRFRLALQLSPTRQGLPKGWLDPLVVACRTAVLALEELDSVAAEEALAPQRAAGERALPADRLVWLTTEAALAAQRGDVARVHALSGQLRGLPAAQRHEAILSQLAELSFTEPSVAWRLYADLWAVRSTPAGVSTLAFEAVREMQEVPLVVGDYIIERSVGRGGMAEVFAARHASMELPVALKVLRTDAGAAATEAFWREIEVVTRLEHPQIVSIFDVGVVSATSEAQSAGQLRAGQPFVVMEWVEGGDVERNPPGSWPELRKLVLQLLAALGYAHAAGVVHRDVKPANVLVAADGSARLADFGLAGMRPGAVAGTPAFMAPEQFEGAEPHPTMDLYAMGCLVWTLATGTPPFQGNGGQRHSVPPFLPRMEVPPGVFVWLCRLMDKQPERRMATAGDAAVAWLSLDDDRMEAGREPSAVSLFLGRADSGAATGVSVQATTELGTTLLEAFLRPRSERALPPTLRLTHRGHPEVVGHAEAQNRLWGALGEATRDERGQLLALEGVPGVGKRTLLASIRFRARLAGLSVSEKTGSGVAVVDMGAKPLEGWRQQARTQPWLLVWTRPTDGSIPTLVLEKLSLMDLFAAIRARASVSIDAAMQAAGRAAGVPGLAVRLVGAWSVSPGYTASARGLVLAGSTPRTTRSEQEYWASRLTSLPSEPLALAALCLESQARTSWSDAVDKLGLAASPHLLDEVSLPGGGMCLIPAVRELLAQRLGPAERRPYHLALAEAEGDSLSKAYHQVRAGGAAKLLADALQRQLVEEAPVPTPVYDALGAALDREGTPAGSEERGWLMLGRFLSPGVYRPEVRLQRLAALAQRMAWERLELAVLNQLPRRAERLDRMEALERSLGDTPCPGLFARAGGALAVGRVGEARALWEQVLVQRVGASQPALSGRTHLALAELGEGKSALRHYRQAIPLLAGSPERRARALAGLSEALLREGRVAEALSTAKMGVAATAPPRVDALLPHSAACALLGKWESARASAGLALHQAVLHGERIAGSTAALLVLAAGGIHPLAFETLYAETRPVADPVLHDVLRAGAARSERRRARLEELAARCRP